MTADCLGLDYDYRNIDLMTGEHMRPKFLSINPQHSLPTLVDGDLILNESRPIVGYLVNKYGNILSGTRTQDIVSGGAWTRTNAWSGRAGQYEGDSGVVCGVSKGWKV